MVRLLSTFFSRVPYNLLEFLKQQVPNVAPQSRAELEFSAAWLLDEELKDVKNTDFKYIPDGPKGQSTPLLDVNVIVSPTSERTQNYIVARSMDARHPRRNSSSTNRLHSTVLYVLTSRPSPC